MSEADTERGRLADRRTADLDIRQKASDARESALAQREEALSLRERALADRMDAAKDILTAADARDAVSDSRDIGGDTREQVLDRAHFLATGDEIYADHQPLRRGAALDRAHAKGDRAASHDDRVALTEGPEDPPVVLESTREGT